MALSLGSLVIRLAADTGTFESDMGRAARVADQQSRAISHSLKTSSRSFSEVSRAFSALNMAGLEQLAGSSQIATGALKGLSGAFALFGVVSWPVAIIAGAVMGLSALVTAAGNAHRELEDLNKVLDANALALNPDPLKRYTDALTQATKVASDSVQTYIKLAQARVAAEAASMAGGGALAGIVGDIIGSREKGAAADVAAAAAAQTRAAAQVGEAQVQQLQPIVKGIGDLATSLQASQDRLNALVTEGQTAYAAAQQSMAQASAAQNKAFMDLITPNAKLNDQIADATAYAQQNPLSDTAKNLTAIIDKMRADFKSGTDSMNEYAKQAAREIQSAFADFLFDPFQGGLRGMLSGFINVIRRIVAERLALQILGDPNDKTSLLNTGLSFLLGSGHASGGAVSADTLYPVNELGPEMLSTGGKDYLMMGGNGGFITPNTNIDTGPAGGGINLTTNIDARGAQDPGQMLAALQVWETKVKRDVITYSQRGYMPA